MTSRESGGHLESAKAVDCKDMVPRHIWGIIKDPLLTVSAATRSNANLPAEEEDDATPTAQQGIVACFPREAPQA
ncbi:hypothetical protein VE03_10795, partial [Pseudogymnoascus sp. 23342-1-I1]